MAAAHSSEQPRPKPRRKADAPSRGPSPPVPKPAGPQAKSANEGGTDAPTSGDPPPPRAAAPGQEPAPPTASRGFLVVGIGASAGGLEALQELLNHLPDETGMAFVIITHQHPGHASALPELLGQCTAMPVVQARDGTGVEPDHVYVGPPGQPVAIKDGVLYLVESPSEELPRLPIDQFFRSLALDQRDRAVCIVLSGTGSDGTLGLKAIKGESGTAMVQSLETARYGSMPSNAIATAQADFVLPPKAMPEHLLAYARTRVGQSRWRSAPHPPQAPPEHRIQKILLALRARTGNDFSRYKSGTLHRRIERRMAVHRIKDLGDYVHLVQQHPQEVDRLFKDLLIGVTSFFRDPEAFEVLRKRVLSRLLVGYPDHRTFRVWTPGCSTGEEAYTIAILLRELMQELNITVDVQLFATDLDAEAIEAARAGRYPLGIAADVPPDFLRRYFVQDGSAYSVRPEIREMIVFAQQNLIKDPPFIRLDFISCRNVLIYLQADLQRRLLANFHHALRPHGFLMLGPSETVESLGEQFQTVDKKWKLFRRRPMSTAPDQPELPTPLSPPRTEPARPTDQPAEPKKPSPVTALIEQLLLARFAPAAVIVDERGEILYIHGRTGVYLEPPPGQPSTNLLAMAREGLQTELAHALRLARGQPREVVRSGVRVKTNGTHVEVDVSVTRLTDPEMLNGLLLVTFRPPRPLPTGTAPDQAAPSSNAKPTDGRIRELEKELRDTNESLQISNEELQTSNEELRSANEELQSSNEELQSTNEELETSKEEMQALNEELNTVNAELQSKVEQLNRANDDMQNLLNSTEVATVFLDDELRIKRYTAPAAQIFRLSRGDLGRPLSDLTSDLRHDRLLTDARRVLDTLERVEQEVEGKPGTWFLMRLIPYRTAENIIEGLVMTFVDITQIKRAEGSEQRMNRLLQDIFDTLQLPALILDGNLRVVKANTRFCRTFNTHLKHTEGRSVYEAADGLFDSTELRRMIEEILPTKTVILDFELTVHSPKRGERIFRLNARQLGHESGLAGRILLTLEDASKP